jgi:preprotein translocase subunit SecE
LGVQVPPPVSCMFCSSKDGKCMTLAKSLISVQSYKPRQGALVRGACQAAGSAVGLCCASAFFTSFRQVGGDQSVLMASSLIFCIFSWLSWRAVHYPPLAEFLIEVQLESSRVEWSTASQVRNTTYVVLSVMFVLSAYLFACDVLLQLLLRYLRVLNF